MSTQAAAQHVRIRPPARWSGLGARELWEYRELAYFLTKRDLQVRYKQTALGALWALVQPLTLTAIFGLVLGRLVQVPTGGVPYFLLALSGVTVWAFVSAGLMGAAGSLVADANLLSKVYFPRLILPLAKVAAMLVDLAVAMVLLIVVAAVTGYLPFPQVLLLPAFLAIAVLTVTAAGVLASALNVRYRDVSAALPLAVLVGLFLTPVGYPASLVSGAWQYVYALNPFATAITGVRWTVLGTEAPSLTALAISIAGGLVLMVVAVITFRRSEAHFADVI
jgi:lipopolysaccharide transport system permease protein